MDTAYQITRERGETVLRFPSQYMDEVQLTRLLDRLELEAIRQQSHLTAADAAMLADEVKRSAWQQVKHLYTDA